MAVQIYCPVVGLILHTLQQLLACQINHSELSWFRLDWFNHAALACFYSPPAHVLLHRGSRAYTFHLTPLSATSNIPLINLEHTMVYPDSLFLSKHIIRGLLPCREKKEHFVCQGAYQAVNKRKHTFLQWSMLHNWLAHGSNEPHPFHLLLIDVVYFSCSFDFTVKGLILCECKLFFWRRCCVLWEDTGTNWRHTVAATLIQLTGVNLWTCVTCLSLCPLTVAAVLLSLLGSSGHEAEFESCGKNCQNDLRVRASTCKQCH